MKSQLKGSLLLLITAFIWGSAFVAQSAGMEYVGPFTFMFTRNVLGVIFLLPVIFFTSKTRTMQCFIPDKATKTGGILCGLALTVASLLQQIGIGMTTAGKAGFITALYIIIVPIFSLLLGKKIQKKIWLCVAIAILGFYMLSVKDSFSIATGDLYVLACAFVFAIHIILVDHFLAKEANPVMMSCIQFFVTAIISMLLMVIFEKPVFSDIWAAKISIIYAGVFSSGIAYTLQMVGQKYSNPTIATLIMSLESVFAALSGFVLLHEVLSFRELAGCMLVFLGVIFAQVDFKKMFSKN